MPSRRRTHRRSAGAAPRAAPGHAPRARPARPARRRRAPPRSRRTRSRGPPRAETSDRSRSRSEAGGCSSSSSARPTLARALSALSTPAVSSSADARRLAQLLDPSLEPRPLGHLEHELPTGRAKRLVDAGQHPAQPPRPVRGQQPDPLRIVRRAELLQREVERLARDHARLVLVEHAEVRVDRRLERVRLQQPVAEPVDRGDPGAVELTREIVPVELGEAAADPSAQLARGPFRVRDREHRVDREPAVADGAHEALDEDGRLSGACPGGDEHEPGRVDRRELLGVRRAGLLDHGHVRATRHIAHRSHQVGHGKPPFGSCWTSPERIRSTKRVACSFARSVCAQNSSSSR